MEDGEVSPQEVGSSEHAHLPSRGGTSTLSSEASGTEEMPGWDSFGLEREIVGELEWDSLGDGYYTHEEMKELVGILTSERREQRAVEFSTQNVRKWIK